MIFKFRYFGINDWKEIILVLEDKYNTMSLSGNMILKYSDYLQILNDIIEIPPNSLEIKLSHLKEEYMEKNYYLYDNIYKITDFVLGEYNKKIKNSGIIFNEDREAIGQRGNDFERGKITNLYNTRRWCQLNIAVRSIKVNIYKNEVTLTGGNVAEIENELINEKTFSPEYLDQLNHLVKELVRYTKGKKPSHKFSDIPLWLKITSAVVMLLIAIVTFMIKLI
jgi:hypothetical protein